MCFQDYRVKKEKKGSILMGQFEGKITFRGGGGIFPGFVGEEERRSPRESIFFKIAPVFLPDKLVYFYPKNEKTPIFA